MSNCIANMIICYPSPLQCLLQFNPQSENPRLTACIICCTLLTSGAHYPFHFPFLLSCRSPLLPPLIILPSVPLPSSQPSFLLSVGLRWVFFFFSFVCDREWTKLEFLILILLDLVHYPFWWSWNNYLN